MEFENETKAKIDIGLQSLTTSMGRGKQFQGSQQNNTTHFHIKVINKQKLTFSQQPMVVNNFLSTMHM